MAASVYQEMGQLDQAGAVLRNVYPAPDDENVFWPIWQQFWLQRQYGKGAAFFRGLIAQDREEPGPTSAFLRCALGEFLRMSGDTQGARENYSIAEDYILHNLEEQPDNTDLLMALAMIYAGQDNFDMALHTTDRAVELLRSSGDAFELADAETEAGGGSGPPWRYGKAIAEFARLPNREI